jgi:ectoine hydroxylase-related dioxygenase (phytanoyl-CoA dioxygenase family)
VGNPSSLSGAVLEALVRDGFVVIPGPVPASRFHLLVKAYDRAVQEADPVDIHHGSSTTRVNDLVNRGPEFDSIYIYPPFLDACSQIFTQPYKLSVVIARTVHPCTPAQVWHQDFPRDPSGWTMVGFILMIDEFRVDNGATRFVPGSHEWQDGSADHAAGSPTISACGAPGSMIIYNGSIWHGHGPNQTLVPRRSIQGAFIRKDLQSGFDMASRMRSETLSRIGPVARCLIVPD